MAKSSRSEAALQRAIAEAQERHRRIQNADVERREKEALAAVVAEAERVARKASKNS